MLSSADTGALAQPVRAELARRRLLDFCELLDPTWQNARHLALIAEQLERIERREIRRLAVCLPPRHGKTELVSKKFVAWYLGRNPSHHVILASYGAELSESNSRAVRTMIDDGPYPFAGVALREDSRSVGRWETNKGGMLVSVGVGSGLTGRGGHLIVGDDLVKDRVEAESESIRATTASWFADVLRTRAAPGAAFVMVGTRWHEADILSTVLEEDGWTKLILPLIAEGDNDALGRESGEWLWPERFGPDDVPSVERHEISSRSFDALYQQRPQPAGGRLFKSEWFEGNRFAGGIPHRRVTEGFGLQSRPGVFLEERSYDVPIRTVLAVDCASKTGIANDFSALVTLSHDEIDFFVVDVVRERLEFTDLGRKIVELHRKWGHSHVFIEDASAGIAIVQELRRWTGLPIIPITPQGSKISRVEAASGLFEAKRLRLPESAAWLDVFLSELLAFPGGRHDDMVDALVLGISQLDRLVASEQTAYSTIESLQGWMER